MSFSVSAYRSAQILFHFQIIQINMKTKFLLKEKLKDFPYRESNPSLLGESQVS